MTSPFPGAGTRGVIFGCFAALLLSCGGGSDGGANLRFELTDGPGNYRAVNVTVSGLRIHRSSGADDSASGWLDLSVSLPEPLDLLSLAGRTLTFSESNVPAGRFQQIRLLLEPNDGSAPPFHNSVVLHDGTEHPLETPSGTTGGLKIVHGFTVATGGVTVVTLDFDGERSVVATGGGRYLLKPVIGATSTFQDRAALATR